MRYTSLSVLLIPVYLVVIVRSKFFDRQDICKNPGLATHENVISENGSYKYSHHYYYSRTIRHNQTYPVVSDGFKNFSTTQNVTPKFSFKYYGNNVTRLKIFRDGKIKIFGEEYIGTISNTVLGNFYPEYEMVDNNDFIAVKWYYEILVDGTSIIAKVTTLIYSNGKISFYYENILTGLKQSPLSSKIVGVIQCGKRLRDMRIPEIITPGEWMTSDTSVRFKLIKISCSIYNSFEKCQNARTSSVKCIWHEKTNMCINSDDNDVKSTTSEINGHSKHNNTPRYLYIVIPVIVVFCVICIGCVIWMYKRKKSNP
ncbi:unnamed protein product [Schistosoma haematobium]|nr:unnamed protein product [Schistosoma haematobium]